MNPRALPMLLAASLLAAEAPLPLPDAPLRLVIPDAQAFDAALTGHFRRFLTGDPRDGEPVTAAWRRSRVGSKLEDQWQRLSPDLPWTWKQILQLKPRSLGLALLEVGHLEAVLVVDTPLAQLPLALPKGTPKNHGGVAYALVTRGAADGSGDKDRRMGLAWARMGPRLLLATSERALLLAITQAQAGRGLEPPLPGLVAMELDLDALRKDRYFRREFLWPEGPERGRVKVALRSEGGRLVEVRRGGGDARPGVFTFQAAGGAQGWEPDGSGFWTAFRRGLLEPLPQLQDRPVPALAPLPEAAGAGDPYAVDLTKPVAVPGGAQGEEGDLLPWKALLAKVPVPSWGFWVTPDGVRRLAFPWPEARDAEFLELCRATGERRAGRATVAKVGPASEIRVGPGLPALALRRAGAVLWAAPSARDLQDVPVPRADAALVRWARVDLDAVRAEKARWAKAEGPARPEQVRPLSDQVLGLLGWIPGTRSLAVERRRTGDGWEERVTFGGAP
ncbi:hypothetical protein [Mesoterricola silvestris]|uniref:Uncharacterized protein n=1 Tax=Mesoterricola silvestris TaxID=2927979 RepID=A0AA48GR65_9BACT|nr:hypothetical protein [Mesoterricola silvestris]BDU74200.1 hypothetical protein METEAL_33740 [Mesoterricola silvestris]